MTGAIAGHGAAGAVFATFLAILLVAFLVGLVGLAGGFDRGPEPIGDAIRRQELAQEARRIRKEAIERALPQILTLLSLPEDFEDEVRKSSGLLDVFVVRRDGDAIEVYAKDVLRERSRLGLKRLNPEKGSLMERVFSSMVEGEAMRIYMDVSYAGRPTSATLAAYERDVAMRNVPAIEALLGIEIKKGIKA